MLPEIIDTHAHIDGEEYADDRDQVVQRAIEAGVSRIFVPAIDVASSERVVEVCRKYPRVCYPMVGLHPEEVRDDWREQVDRIEALLDDPAVRREVIAIGEVGIDYYWSRDYASEQIEALERQVQLAVRHRLPLMIHCRKGQQELVHLLKKYEGQLCGGVFHCFTGNEFEAAELLRFDGFVLGIGGVLTFKKSNLPAVLPAHVPIDRIVLETDSPYMAPVPHRGKRNESAFVRHVLDRLSSAYSLTVDEVARVTTATALRVMRGVIALLLLLLPLAVFGQVDSVRRWGLEVNGGPSRVVVMDEYQRKWQKGTKNGSVSMVLKHSAVPQDSDAYAADFGYPTLGVGVKYSMNHGVTMHRSPDPDWGMAEEVDYDSRMGNSVAVYGQFARPLLRSRRWQFDYTLEFGVGYSRRKYSKVDNIDNELIGSRWLVYFGAGVHAKYRVAREWAVMCGVDYWHLSNGALNRPNKGANCVGPTLGVSYEPYAPYINGLGSWHAPFSGYWFVRLTAGMGGKTLNEDWQRTQFHTPPGEARYRTSRFHLYPTYMCQVALMRRYARRWASGIGLDVDYGSYADDVEEYDRASGSTRPHSPWSVGLSGRHTVYYHRFRLDMALGWYLYRHMGDDARVNEKRYYERIGVHYALPFINNVVVGVNVKAHRTKADLTELALSWEI